jgi:hypothetical protein
MVRRLILCFLAPCMLMLDIGCNSERCHSTDVGRDLTKKDAAEFTAISRGVTRATSLTLYEGLPHQTWETDQYQHELAAKKTVQLHHYPFYERTLSVGEPDREELRHLSASAETYFTFSGEKSCGGFHPDYCVTWFDGAVVYELLICFGCDEMKLYSPMQYLRFDIRGSACGRLKAVLSKYRDQRPIAK